jgi:hypothetical protein
MTHFKFVWRVSLGYLVIDVFAMKCLDISCRDMSNPELAGEAIKLF